MENNRLDDGKTLNVLIIDSTSALLEKLLTFKMRILVRRWEKGFSSKDKWNDPVVYGTWLRFWFWASTSVRCRRNHIFLS